MNELGKPRIPSVTKKQPNVFKEKPAVGTILATMTADELALHEKVWEATQACELADDVSYSQALETVEKKNRFWAAICRKYGIPYSWGISVDPISGEVYISE